MYCIRLRRSRFVAPAAPGIDGDCGLEMVVPFASTRGLFVSVDLDSWREVHTVGKAAHEDIRQSVRAPGQEGRVLID